MSYTVVCPHCGTENEIDGINDLESFEHQCCECENEFKVNVDAIIVLTGSIIEFKECPVCKENKKNVGYRIYSKNSYEDVCWDCYKKIEFKKG